MRTFLSVILTIAYLSTFGQKDSIAFNILRQNDKNFVTSNTKSFPYNLKEIPLKNKNNTISFGGSYRYQNEKFNHYNFEQNQNLPFWYLHRFMLHSDISLNENLTFFLEINSSLIQNKDEISPVDRDELSLNQMFLDFSMNENWNIKLGRENFRLGSGRLVDLREGPNVRLAFDKAELNYINSNGNSKLKIFYAIPVQQKAGVFDNDALNNNETLSAIYYTLNTTSQNSFDIYTLFKKEENKVWSANENNDERLSIGLRNFGTFQKLTYNNEFVYQTGKFGDSNISAWTASINIERDFSAPFPLIGGLKAEMISGDLSKNDNVLNTFDGLYPRGAYFGRVAYFGPSNLIDLHPFIKTTIKDVNLEFDYVAFWRYSTEDGVYSAPLILNFPDNNNEQFIAHQFGTIAAYQVNNFISAEVEGNIILPKSFLAEQDLTKPLTHFVMTLQATF